MSPIWLRRRGHVHEHTSYFIYRFAAGRLISDQEVLGLEPLHLKDPEQDPPAVPLLDSPQTIPEHHWRPEQAPRFQNDVWVCERPWKLACYRSRGLDLLAFEGGTVAITTDGDLVEWQLDQTIPAAEQNAWMHGPALCSALAHRGIFCLHGSAALTPGGAVAFIGESGAGKSTLVSLLAELGWPKVADDVFPVLPISEPAMDREGGEPEIRISPEIAHLGLPAAQRQAIARLPSTLPLTQICLLKPTAAGENVQGRPLSPSESVAALLGQTIAVNLFDPSLAGRLLDHWAEVVNRIRVLELTYPKSPDVGKAVQRVLSQ